MSRALDLLIHTEASPQIGHGHVTRCSALADEACHRGLTVGFLARNVYTHTLLESLGYPVFRVGNAPSAVRWIIRDFRDGSDAYQVAEEVAAGTVVLLLDEPGPARTEASLVSDGLMTEYRRQHFPHGPDTCYLYGLDYVPLRSAFTQNAGTARPGQREAARLLVAFGGAATGTLTRAYIEALERAGFAGPATIVTGPVAMDKQQISQWVSGWGDTQVVSKLDAISAEMVQSDLVASKLGVIPLEAFCCGVGCVLIEPSEAHVALQADLALEYPQWPALELGLDLSLDFALAAETTLTLLQDRQQLTALGRCGASLVDGKGAQRLIDALVKHAAR